MTIQILIWHIITSLRMIAPLHTQYGPDGWVSWIQPQHLAAGIGQVHGHLVSWWQVQS